MVQEQESELVRLRQRVAQLEQTDALRKHIFEELKKSNSRLKETERLAKIGSWEMDIATGESFWSEGFYRIIGMDASDVEPSAEVGMNIIHPDDRERAASEVQRAIAEGGEYDIEKRIIRPDGEIRTVLSLGEIVRDEENNSSKLVGAFLDITEQKKIEEEIRKLNTELELRVAERTRELEEANKKLQLISITDALTGVYNRRYFNEAIDSEWRRAIRSKEPLSLIMMDIDFFKAYNDCYGHLEGDGCLKNVANALKKSIHRTSDILVRYGGEEFAALLPVTDLPGAQKVAQSMQLHINKLGLVHCDSPIAEYVTISMGIASVLPKKGMKLTDLIQSADEALYKAKKNGRNRIEISD
jgi:diguanylate cyclase (GGDEF)-like protein/PAS domain S-box-containing protein